MVRILPGEPNLSLLKTKRLLPVKTLTCLLLGSSPHWVGRNSRGSRCRGAVQLSHTLPKCRLIRPSVRDRASREYELRIREPKLGA